MADHPVTTLAEDIAKRLSKKYPSPVSGRLWRTLAFLRDEEHLPSDVVDDVLRLYSVKPNALASEDRELVRRFGFLGVREFSLDLVSTQRAVREARNQLKKLEDGNKLNFGSSIKALREVAVEDWWIWVVAALAMGAAVGFEALRQKGRVAQSSPSAARPLPEPSAAETSRWVIAVVVEAASLAGLETGWITVERASDLFASTKYFLTSSEQRWDSTRPTLSMTDGEIDRSTRDFVLVTLSVSGGPAPDSPKTTMALRSRVLEAKSVRVTKLAKLAAPPDPTSTGFIRV